MSGAPQRAQAGASQGGARWWGDSLVLVAVALAARLGVVLWAWHRFPPTADGSYYHTLASRLAQGQGYTWLWPDGAVTFAAHYPVGYPALLAVAYALGGAVPGLGMVVNALLGALGVLAVHRLLVGLGRRRWAGLGAGLVALHPALVAYTPALMTEGVTASLVACLLWAAGRLRAARGQPRALLWCLGLGALCGLATLVRPQSLLLAPLLGLCGRPRHGADGPQRKLWRLGGVPLLVTAAALAVCAPWTMRNCARMHSCALVSVNLGWNLLIGTEPDARGGWAPLQVPARCREVFDEAQKDRCFAAVATERIVAAPGAWLRLGPDKLAATFDYCGAAGWYLHQSNPEAFSERGKVALGIAETLVERLLLLLGLVLGLPRPLPRGRPGWRLLARSPRRLLALGLVAVGAVAAVSVHAWVGYLALATVLLVRRPGLASTTLPLASSWAVLASLLVAHVAFFGGGRYALIAFVPMCVLATLGMAALCRKRAGRHATAPSC